MQSSDLTRLYLAVDAVRTVSASLPTQTFAALLAVALEEGLNINQIGVKIGIAQSSASRNIAALTAWDWKKRPGLKLVEYRQDPMNLSIKTVHLTKAGRQLIEHLILILGGSTQHYGHTKEHTATR
jgi:DNA-binding MarR family transcriptional regulator